MSGTGARLEIVVEVGDVPVATAFYEGLGLRVVRTGTWEDGVFAELEDERGTRLLLTDGDGGARVTLTVPDATAARDRAVERGAVASGDVGPGGGGAWARATDPWGNPLGFWSAP